MSGRVSDSALNWREAGADVPEVLDSTLVEPSLAGAEVVGGSTGALLIEYDGRPYIYKYNKPGIVVNEFVAFKLYAAAGGRVPRVHLVINYAAGGIPQAVLIQFIPGVTVAKAFKDGLLKFGEKITLYESIKTDFLLHALFANWDAKNSENHMIPITPTGEYEVATPYTIDMGGALFYRASGERKPPRYFTSLDVDELESIPEVGTTSRLFTYPTEGDLRDPRILYQNVCNRLLRIKKDDILNEVTRLRALEKDTLFDFYPLGKDLRDILFHRIGIIDLFCRRVKYRETIRAETEQVEEGPSAFHMYRTDIEKGEKYKKAGGTLYDVIVESLKDEAFKPLDLNGKRTLVDLGAITKEELDRIVITRPSPLITRKVYAGAAAGNWEEDDSVEEAILSAYPEPHLTITLDGTAAATNLKHKMFAPRTDPKLRAWLEAQTAFIKTELTPRERDILISYTRHGDRLANNYLRRTLRDDLKDLMNEIIKTSIESSTASNYYSVPLAYSILDQIDDLVREKKHLLQMIPEEWEGDMRNISEILQNTDGTLNMESVAKYMKANYEFFFSARQIESLVAQYVRDLYAIMKKAPRAPHTFTVFRGFDGDSYMSSLNFRAVDFLSTSLSTKRVFENFVNHMIDPRIKRFYASSVYEMEVRPNVPCIYMESITQYAGEYEILLPPGVVVETDDKVYMKYYQDKADNKYTIRNESGPRGPGRFVATVECVVRLPKAGERAGQLVALGDMRVRDPPRDVSERFSSAKPRGERVGRGHKKRITWKAERRAKRKTRRAGSGSGS